MKSMKYSFKLFGAMLFALGTLTGCESPDGGGTVSGSAYYGTAFDDPWYHGEHYHDSDVIVSPPPSRPIHPEQPIYRPSGPGPTPMPSIPSAPRPTPRPAMRR